MNLQEIEKDLRENGLAFVNDFELFTRSGQILVRKRNGARLSLDRPPVWGSCDESGNISWSFSVPEMESKLEKYSNGIKTTIGTHVSEDEFVEISRLCEILGITKSQFCHEALTEKTESVKAKLDF